MTRALAYADTTDPTQGNFLILLLCILLIGCVAFMAFLVIFLARSRRHRRADYIMALVIFWALATAGSVAYSADAHLAWAQENTLRLESGYGNPDDVSDVPQTPWKTWLALAAAWGGLISWSMSQKNPPPASSGQSPSDGAKN